uniref:Uncharacterized protein n=2 Tax=Aegilops tauschii TaxID=37682 RepID=A0A453KRP7_AEGTS
MLLEQIYENYTAGLESTENSHRSRAAMHRTSHQSDQLTRPVCRQTSTEADHRSQLPLHRLCHGDIRKDDRRSGPPLLRPQASQKPGRFRRMAGVRATRGAEAGGTRPCASKPSAEGASPVGVAAAAAAAP